MRKPIIPSTRPGQSRLNLGLSARWGRAAKRSSSHQVSSLNIAGNLPEPLLTEDIHRLLSLANPHELDHLIAEAARHTASLRQLHERLQSLGDRELKESNLNNDISYGESPEDFRHAFEHWRLRLAVLEMIASAQQSLRSLATGEKESVASARHSLRNVSSSPISTSRKS